MDTTYTDGALGDDAVTSSDDEEITGFDGTTATETITLGEHTFDLTIDDTGDANGAGELIVTATEYYTGSFGSNVDVSGDGSADTTVYFAMTDTNSDGVYENIELSWGNQDYGDAASSGTITTSDTNVNIGNAEFTVKYDGGTEATNLGDSGIDAQISANVYTASQSIDGQMLNLASVDTDSDGVYDELALSTTDTTYGEGTQTDATVADGNDEVLSGADVVSISGSADTTKFHFPSTGETSAVVNDPVNDAVELDVGFEFSLSGQGTVTAFTDGTDLQIDFNNDGDLQDDGESGAYATGEYLTSNKNLDGTPVGPLNEDYVVRSIGASSFTLDPVPKAGFTYDLRVLDDSQANTQVYLDDVGVEVIDPVDNGDWNAPASITLDSNGAGTFTGLALGAATGAGTTGSVYLEVNTASDGTGTTVADIEAQASDYDDVSVSTSVNNTLQYQQTSDITVTVNQGGSALSNAKVELILDGDGDGVLSTGPSSSIATGFTDSNGEKVFTQVTPSQAGTLVVKVTKDIAGAQADDTSDTITDIENTASTTEIQPIPLSVSTSANLLADFSAQPTFTLETPDGNAWAPGSTPDGDNDGATVYLRGAVLDSASFTEDAWNSWATDGAGSDNANGIDGDVQGASFTPDATGDLMVNARHDTAGGAAAEYNGTASFTVSTADNLNVGTNVGDNAEEADGNGDTIDVTVQGIDAASPDGPDNDGDHALKNATVSISGPGVSQSTGAWYYDTDNAGNDASGHYNLDDAAGQAVDTVRFSGVSPTQNGTIEVTVTAYGNNGNEYTYTENISVEGDKVDVSPTTVEAGSAETVSVTVTDGAGTPINNREVYIYDTSAGVDATDLFTKDIDNDDTAETITAVNIDGSDGQLRYRVGNAWTGAESISVNNGLYEVSGLTFETAGTDIGVEVDSNQGSGGNPPLGTGAAGDGLGSPGVYAKIPDAITTQGVSVYNVSSSVDPVLRGVQETVNLTVTNATGATVTGSELQELAKTQNGVPGDQSGDNLKVTQKGTVVGSTVSTVDTSGDGTDDAIQVDLLATEGVDRNVNISVSNDADTRTGSGTVDVVAPTVMINDSTQTEGLRGAVEVTVMDPRDNSRLSNADVQLTAANGTVEIDSFGEWDADSAGVQNDGGDGYEMEDTENVQANDLANSNATFAVFAHSRSDSPLTLDVSVAGDDTTFTQVDSVVFDNISATADPSTIPIGETSTVTVDVTDAENNALANRGVSLSGAVSASGSTDSEGFIAFQVSPQATGTINVDVDIDDDFVGGDSDVAAGATVTRDTVTVKTSTDLQISANATTVLEGDSVQFTVTRADTGANVNASVAFGGQQAYTGSDGTVVLSTTQTGEVNATASKAETGSTIFTNDTVSVTVQGSQLAGSVTFDNATVQNGTEMVTVQNASYTLADGTAGDYVVVLHVVNETDGSISSPVGFSGNLTGDASSVMIDLNASDAQGDDLDVLTENTTLRAMLHEPASGSAYGGAISIDGSLVTDDATFTVQETIAQPANFTVSNLSPMDVTVTQGDVINVSATVTNDGGSAGTQTVEFRVDGTALANQSVSLDAGNSTTVEFTGIDTSSLAAGNYTHGVYTANASQTATLTVENATTGFSPSNYDTDGDGSVEGDFNGVIEAISDYNAGQLTFDQVIQVISAYNGA